MANYPPHQPDNQGQPIPNPSQPYAPPVAPAAAQGDSTGGIIPYKNSSALIAYYCGVFSIIPCFPIGLVAFVLGIKGLQYAKQHPEAKGTVHAWIGILAGGLFGFGYLLLTLLTVLLPLLSHS